MIGFFGVNRFVMLKQVQHRKSRANNIIQQFLYLQQLHLIFYHIRIL